MHYPVIVHHEEDKGYGVTVVDFPGCFTAGDTLEEALGNVQEAVELWMDDDEELPLPTPFEQLGDHAAMEHGGALALVDIDLYFASTKTHRVNVTIPGHALSRIDRAADAEGRNRSAFLVESALKRIQTQN